jgi:UDP-N-acetylmuramoyl-tripeptide--D-alanyl-D-alanine ligase
VIFDVDHFGDAEREFASDGGGRGPDGSASDGAPPSGAATFCSQVDASFCDDFDDPTSMRAAFEVLGRATVDKGGRRIAVLGDMLELGARSEEMHSGLAGPLEAAGIDLVFTCGAAMAALHEKLPKKLRGAHEADSKALAPKVAAAAKPGDSLLVKGSLGSRMAVIVEALLALGSAKDAANGPKAANGQ